MKTSKKKWLYRALCAALVVTLTAGTAVMTPVADIVGTNITANARGGENGTEYYIGNILNTNGSKYIIPDNRYSSTYSYDISAVVPTPTYRKAENYWYFDNIIRSGWGFTMADNAFSGTETVIGFRCVSGDGSSSNTAFKFDLIYENETDTCEMDFSDVAESLVSIKDANENTVALNNGKATIKTGYVITSAKPLSFPKTYAVQQTDENNFVYVIKNMIQSEKKVAYDTSAFKGTVTAYEGRGVTVEGYEGTSVQKFSRTPYYMQSVTVDFSHGTMLTGRNDYYNAPLDKFFDIYNADGENITDLFEFSNLAGSYYNYYYYKLKQNLETDIYVFPTGTQFTITLPEGVEIENKDVILSQEGNVYTVKPASDVTLLSDSLINIYRNSTLVTLDIGYSAVKNHQFVYEVKVTNQFNAEISTASVIRTQEEFKNVKTGDYIMPTETLNISDEGYGWYDVGEYIGQSGYYSQGGGSGSSIGSSTITIGTDLKINGSSQFTPVNPYLCTESGRYDIDTYKGNAWRVDFVGSKYGYDKAIGLKGTYYTEPAEYEFTWSDDHSTATVTFNGGEPADADVTREADSANSQWVYTATKAYDNGIPYIETKNINGYTVKWEDENGTVLETDENVETGLKPTYDGESLTKESTAQYNYTFAGWTSDGGTTVYTAETLPAVTKAVTYTAVFDEELITYPFTADTSLNNITLTVADHENNAVTVTDGAFNAPIGSKISASVPLAFNGATANETIDGSTFTYTVTSVTSEQVTISNAQIDISDLTITADNQTYTGSALTPVVVKNGENALVENTDYTVTYDDNINAGKVTATIVCKGRYKGTQTVNFNINKKNFAELDVKFDFDGNSTAYTPKTYSPTANTPSIVYDGKEYTPTAKLLFSNEEVPADSYDVSITSAQNADTYTITFTAKENTNFTGTRTFDWDINKADMTITMTDGLSFNRVGGKVAGECVDESKFAVTGAPDGSLRARSSTPESAYRSRKLHRKGSCYQ